MGMSIKIAAESKMSLYSITTRLLTYTVCVCVCMYAKLWMQVDSSTVNGNLFPFYVILSDYQLS